MQTKERNLSFSSGLVLIAFLAAIAAVLFPLIAVSGDWSAIYLRDGTASSATRQVWLVLISMQGAIWVLIVGWLVDFGARFVRAHKIPITYWVAEVLIPGVVLLVFAAVLTFGSRPSIPADGNAKTAPGNSDVCSTKAGSIPIPPPCLGSYHIEHMKIIGATGFLVAFACVLGMFSLRLALRSNRKAGDLGSRVLQYVQLHTDLRSCVLLASLVLALGTVAGAALRNAVNAVSESSTTYPAEYIAAYGLINSVFLVIAYFPVEFAFLQAGIQLGKEYAGEPGESADSIGQWQKRAADASQLLGTDWTDLRGVTGALAALGPAVAGMLTHLLSSK